MGIAFALLVIMHLAAVSCSSLYRIRREDENGRDGGSGESDADDTSLLGVIPSVAPLIPLRFSFLTTASGNDGGLEYVQSSIPALELAVRHINANSSVLPRFNLSYELQELECSTEGALDAFFKGVFSRDSILAFLGSACPKAVEPIAELVHRWNISEILASPLEIEVSEGSAPKPNLLRLYPQESTLVPATLLFARQSQWKRVLVITGKETMFEDMLTLLSSIFQQHNITVAHRELPLSSVSSVSDLLGEEDDYRIIFLNVNPAPAREILCEAYHRGHRYPFYTWILYGWYDSGWWKRSHSIGTGSENCTDEQIAGVLEYSFALRVYPTPSDKDATSDTGISYNQFHRGYSQLLEETYSAHQDTSWDSYSFLAPLTYDAVWTLALALHKVDTVSQIQLDADVIPDFCGATASSSDNLGAFNYSNFYLGCRIRHELLNTNFVGVSGEVTFNEEGARNISTVTLLQYRSAGTTGDVSEVEIAEYDIGNGDLVYHPEESNATVFPDGITPDGTPRNVTVSFYLGLAATYYTIAAVGIVFTFVCLIFNVKYRNTRVVKLTSPTINYFLIVGSFMMFLSIYIRVLPHTGEMVNIYRCNIQAWVNTIAYCFGYGTILTKMGRVYKIFHNPSAKKNQIGVKDWHMVIIVALITGAGVLLLTVMTVAFRANPAVLPSDEYGSGKDDLGVTINYYAWQCYGGENKAPFYYLLFIFSYLGLLQLVGLVLAIGTRKVKISILNDSKYIAAIVYVSSLVVVVMMLVTFVSGNLQNLNEAFFSAGLLLSTYTFLGLTFIPKVSCC
jgi:gamma-aminobutyric acid type B receptor